MGIEQVSSSGEELALAKSLV